MMVEMSTSTEYQPKLSLKIEVAIYTSSQHKPIHTSIKVWHTQVCSSPPFTPSPFLLNKISGKRKWQVPLLYPPCSDLMEYGLKGHYTTNMFRPAMPQDNIKQNQSQF